MWLLAKSKREKSPSLDTHFPGQQKELRTKMSLPLSPCHIPSFVSVLILIELPGISLSPGIPDTPHLAVNPLAFT